MFWKREYKELGEHANKEKLWIRESRNKLMKKLKNLETREYRNIETKKYRNEGIIEHGSKREWMDVPKILLPHKYGFLLVYIYRDSVSKQL